MLTKRIIPCLDVKEGRVVKGTNFVGLRDAGDPVERAAAYDLEGADELVFLDITATFEERKAMLDVIRKTAGQVFMPLTVGGGISSVEDIRNALLAGADKTSLNSAAVKNPQLIADGARMFGNQCIVLAIDARRVGENKWEVYVAGGRKPTGIDAVEWAKQGVALGAGEILLTSMDADGTKNVEVLNLNDNSLITSPYFNLQQNDIIYVSPNKMRMGQSTINDNSVRSISTWLSVSSVLTSIAILIFR